MTDILDLVQVQEQADRERALAAHKQRVASSFTPRDASVDKTCIDCAEPIEPARLLALAHKTSRCASCAAIFEKRSRGFR